MNAIGHTLVRFKQQAWEPMASVGVDFCRKRAPYNRPSPPDTTSSPCTQRVDLRVRVRVRIRVKVRVKVKVKVRARASPSPPDTT